MSDLHAYFSTVDKVKELEVRIAELEVMNKRYKDMNTYYRKRLSTFERSTGIISERKSKCLDLLRKKKSGYLKISMKEIAERCFYDINTVHSYSSMVNTGRL